MIDILSKKDIPQYLPKKYFRECADEDGCLTKYKYVTDKPSYLEGAQKQYDHMVRNGWVKWDREKVIANLHKPELSSFEHTDFLYSELKKVKEYDHD